VFRRLILLTFACVLLTHVKPLAVAKDVNINMHRLAQSFMISEDVHRYQLLEKVQYYIKNNETQVLPRQNKILSRASNLLKIITNQPSETPVFRAWEEAKLPENVPIKPGLELTGVHIVSENSDFAFDKPIRVALLIHNTDGQKKDKFELGITNGWILEKLDDDYYITVGFLENLIVNSGFERPSLDSRVPGILSPFLWGGDDDSWRRIYLREFDLEKGRVACVTGNTRLSFPFKKVEMEEIVLFGIHYQNIGIKDIEPFLIALSLPDEAVLHVNSFQAVQGPDQGGWFKAYGVFRARENIKISIFMDSYGDDNHACVDNAFIGVLPSWLVKED
jgi:hypothetical protein